MAIISWNKKYTETLAITVERFRSENTQYADSKITYAGRLDPMAEGLVLLLTDEDVHKKDQLLGYDKHYDVDFIVGMETDTQDILGIVTTSTALGSTTNENIKDIVNQFTDIRSQQYPAYSSKPVSGKPLWQWAREGKIAEITIPERSVTIFSAELVSSKIIRADKLNELITASVGQVSGDFRQNEIIRSWQTYFKQAQCKEYTVYSIRIHASSGTYMRSLVDSIGKHTGIGATTLKITRRSIGTYHIAE